VITVPQLNCDASNNFGGLGLGTWKDGERVPVVTIDSFNLPRCNFIKVDVEGMEGDVIAGAEQTIRRTRPLLYLENDRKEKSAALIQQLFDLGYRLYWHLPPMFSPKNYFAAAENVFPGTISVNMLGIHSAFTQNIDGLKEIKSPNDYWKD
jgi:hypothetical protein